MFTCLVKGLVGWTVNTVGSPIKKGPGFDYLGLILCFRFTLTSVQRHVTCTGWVTSLASSVASLLLEHEVDTAAQRRKTEHCEFTTMRWNYSPGDLARNVRVPMRTFLRLHTCTELKMYKSKVILP